MGQQQRGHIWRCCVRLKTSIKHILNETDVVEGVGAVGVFIGVGLLCVGIVFTIVNVKVTHKDDDSSLAHIGPILIVVALFCIVIGYFLTNAGNLSRIWTYVKKRKQFPYIDYDHYYENDVNRNLFSVVCFKIMKTCFRIREGRQHADSAEFSGSDTDRRASVVDSDQSNSRIVCETDQNYQSCRRRKSSVDVKQIGRRSNSVPLIMSPTRHCKVSPDKSGSVSDGTADVQHDGSFDLDSAV